MTITELLLQILVLDEMLPSEGRGNRCGLEAAKSKCLNGCEPESKGLRQDIISLCAGPCSRIDCPHRTLHRFGLLVKQHLSISCLAEDLDSLLRADGCGGRSAHWQDGHSGQRWGNDCVVVSARTAWSSLLSEPWKLSGF